MKKLFVILFVLMAFVSTSFAADKAAAPVKGKAEKAAPAKTDDASITAAVKEKLAGAPSLKDVKIDVETKAGVVTMKGVVKNPQVKGVATKMAKGVKGVKSVDNQITVEKADKKDKKDDKKAKAK
jgi:hyperosmotically inducible periplasmic protein